MKTVILGAGGHGRDVLVALRAHDERHGSRAFAGFIDDGDPHEERLARIGATHLGGSDVLEEHRGSAFVVGVGDPRLRALLAQRALEAGLLPTTIVHHQATIGADVVLGPGTVLCAGARLTTNVRTGLHVHVNINVTVAHDVVLGDYVTLNPQAAISGDVVVEAEATIGTGAVIRQGINIGQGAIVGAGAAVVHDVAAGTVVVGVPARRLRETQADRRLPEQLI
ncbi:NeuD/PglB/VioB family sugar acetyltransferase [Ornithinimicrobium sp. LYQ103]|uniref:NeuD/PglB/VioB family sugar acetyltransferase n=1 Tax=Ornithinimicrobium sp. LYQ103 TaxID=3378796 RepID=UPI00385565A8